MIRGVKPLALTVIIFSLALFACKRSETAPGTSATDATVAPATAPMTNTSYVGGGGNVTTTTGPTSTDTAGTATPGTSTTSTSAHANKARSEPTKKKKNL